jgi:TonB-linked SusC/RagA family outer membrane protein
MENAKVDFCDVGTGMLRSFLLFLFLLPLLSASAQTVRFGQSKVSIKTAIEAIEKQTSYSVDYTGNLLNMEKLITVRKGSNSVRSVMKQIAGKDLSYSIQGRHLILSEKAEKKEIPPTRKAEKKWVNLQESMHTLKGVVVDNITNDPLIGATIKIEGQPGGAVTDVNGDFVLRNVSTSSELTVSYIGYKTRTVLAGDLAVMTIKMNSANDQVGEVVVVGAGTQRKVSVTGAITSISGDELKTPSSSLTNALEGKLAGVISMASSGEPGSTSQFYIRGVGTFGGRTTPLILLDDVEISAGDLNRIPPESIKSFTILKDASATAIYGARGANGVMLITTKEGTENSKTQIHVTIENSYLSPQKRVKYVDGATYMDMYNEALQARTPGATPKYSQETIDNTRNHVNPYIYPDVNWYKLLFKNGCFNQRANLNVTGGGSRVTYYMSIQANHNTGLLNIPHNYSLSNNYNDWEYIFQNNITYKLTSTTKLGLHINTQIGNSKGPNASSSDILWQTWNVDPVSFPAYYPAEDGDTHIRFGNAILSGSQLYTNPYANMLNSFQEDNYSTINTSLHFDQDLGFLTKGLNLTALINWRSYSDSYYSRSLTPYYYRVVDGSWSADSPSQYTLEQVGASGTDYISQSGITRYNNNTFYFDTRLNYNRRFGDHNIGAMLMYMMREYRSDVLPNRNQGISGRVTYDYQEKYLAEVNFGYNGTERLAKGHRFEFFPAASVGWVISSEKFWKPIEKYINFMKLRGSYGLVGSDETGESAGAAHFLYKNSVALGGSAAFYTGTSFSNSISKRGPGFNSYAVENAHWERAKELDLGVDMNLLNQVNVVFDYFHNKRDRILLRRGSWPQIMGYWNATPWSNIGKVDNKGFELSVNWRKNLAKDFHIDLRGNLTYNQNKYVYVDDPNYPYVWQTTTGKPLSRLTGYIAEGLFKDERDIALSPDQTSLGSTPKPGDIKYRDVNGDGKITSEDEVMISPYGSTPRLQYGIGISFDWKKIDFGVFFNGSAKRSIMINGLDPFNTQSGHGNRNVMQWIAENYWSESNPNPDAKYPRLGLTQSDISNNTQPSTYWMRCGNFLRWKTLEIGYSFPHCRVYFSGDNLAVWSPFKLWDPEIWWNTYPLQRTLNIGIQVKF